MMKSSLPEAALTSEDSLSAFIDDLTRDDMKRLLIEVLSKSNEKSLNSLHQRIIACRMCAGKHAAADSLCGD